MEKKGELSRALRLDNEILILCLESHNVLAKMQSEQIRKTDDPNQRIDMLLDMLAREGHTTYKTFIDVLLENGYEHVAKELAVAGWKKFPKEFTNERGN